MEADAIVANDGKQSFRLLKDADNASFVAHSDSTESHIMIVLVLVKKMVRFKVLNKLFTNLGDILRV